MKFKGMSRSHLFLIELIVVILFFSFASVITVQIFSKSFQLAENTTALNGAVMAVQTAAETDKTILFKNIDPSEKIIYYNKDWKITDRANSVYTLTSDVTMEEKWAGTMAVYNYTMSSDDKTIYQLKTKKYYSGETTSTSPDEVN